MRRSVEDFERDARVNEAARDERLRADGARSLGENLEEAADFIRAAFALAQGLDSGRR
jgi:hypothetical protein